MFRILVRAAGGRGEHSFSSIDVCLAVQRTYLLNTILDFRAGSMLSVEYGQTEEPRRKMLSQK